MILFHFGFSANLVVSIFLFPTMEEWTKVDIAKTAATARRAMVVLPFGKTKKAQKIVVGDMEGSISSYSLKKGETEVIIGISYNTKLPPKKAKLWIRFVGFFNLRGTSVNFKTRKVLAKLSAHTHKFIH